MSDFWEPGLPGWYNINAVFYVLILLFIFTLPITAPVCYKIYHKYRLKKEREQRAALKVEEKKARKRKKKKR